MKKMFGILIMFSLHSIVSGQTQEDYIIYKKGACFGQCPMYDILVSDSGKLSFEGKRFLDALGRYERQLTKREFRKVKRYFRRARMQKIPFMDESNIMDAALTTIKYKEHVIKRKTGTPEELKKAEAFLLSLTPLSENADFDWTFTPHPEPKVQNNGRKENAQPEIIVQMAADVDFDAWLADYHKYGLTMKKKLVPNRELYLLSYEPKMLSFTAVLKRLKSDPAVKSAEENKKVEQR